MNGPTIPIAIDTDIEKYRQKGESFAQKCARIAGTLSDTQEHYDHFVDILKDQRFLPGGRIQSAIGSYRQVTAFNCFVMQPVPDSFKGIMKVLDEAGTTMRMGGGVGYDFSALRPKGAPIKSLDSKASGPVSFMSIFDAMCGTIASAGHRRGAQMACLRVDHPDILEYVTAKNNTNKLTNFNTSILVTDEFMEAVIQGKEFDLKWNGTVYETVNASALWDTIMRSTWDWAEPGVIFVDRINKMNNLWYIENISATNPCLHGDSIIETVEGRKKIKDITEPVGVYTMLPDGSLGVRKATASWVSKRNSKTIVVEVESGKKVTCTPDHKIFVRNKGWVRAYELTTGDELVHLCRARRGAAYSGIKLTTEDNRAYRMEHRFQYEGMYGPLKDGFDVHHIDGNTYNNVLSNLCGMSHSEHSATTRKECANNHQVKGPDGRWISNNSDYSKPIIGMPEELKSNLKNKNGARVKSIIEGPVVDVYDMSVEETHNFIADFIVVHNCGEQPLPAYGACLLGSFNLAKYVWFPGDSDMAKAQFQWEKFKHDIPDVVRAMDNVIDKTIYPLKEQEEEAKQKRRMGLGITGLANCLSVLGFSYGSTDALMFLDEIMSTLANTAYMSSVSLAIEKGYFPAYQDDYLRSNYLKVLDKEVVKAISKHGIRNSHLISIAPTGTISITANNVSSGLEPVYRLEYTRDIITADGPKKQHVKDYAYAEWGVKGETTEDVTVEQHVDMLTTAQKWVDSAVSKTCNVGSNVTWEQFKDIYMRAYLGGAKGCTTFREDGKRMGILNKVKEDDHVVEGSACFIDLETGIRSCE